MSHKVINEMLDKIKRLEAENKQLKERNAFLESRVAWASWEQEYLRSQIPENHEMGQ